MFDPFSETPVDGVIAATCSVQVRSSDTSIMLETYNILSIKLLPITVNILIFIYTSDSFKVSYLTTCCIVCYSREVFDLLLLTLIKF